MEYKTPEGSIIIISEVVTAGAARAAHMSAVESLSDNHINLSEIKQKIQKEEEMKNEDIKKDKKEEKIKNEDIKKDKTAKTNQEIQEEEKIKNEDIIGLAKYQIKFEDVMIEYMIESIDGMAEKDFKQKFMMDLPQDIYQEVFAKIKIIWDQKKTKRKEMKGSSNIQTS